jgi:hypothetical protein
MTNRPGPYRFLALRRAMKLSAVKARHLRNASQLAIASDEKHAVWQSLELWSKRLTTLTAILFNLAGYVTFGAIVYFLAKDFRQTTIAIAPISVPQTLATTGYTSDVAAQWLRTALNKAVEKTHSLTFISDARSNSIEPISTLQTDLPNVTVPGPGLSLETIFVHSSIPVTDGMCRVK